MAMARTQPHAPTGPVGSVAGGVLATEPAEAIAMTARSLTDLKSKIDNFSFSEP